MLLKLALHRSRQLDVEKLSSELGHSPDEIKASIHRLRFFGFFDLDNRLIISYVKKFLIFDLHDLFPVCPGQLTRGTLTGSRPGSFLDPHLPSTSIWVWPNPDDNDHGLEIVPLSPHCCFASLKDSRLKDLLGVTETLRVIGQESRLWCWEKLEQLLPEG